MAGRIVQTALNSLHIFFHLVRHVDIRKVGLHYFALGGFGRDPIHCDHQISHPYLPNQGLLRVDLAPLAVFIRLALVNYTLYKFVADGAVAAVVDEIEGVGATLTIEIFLESLRFHFARFP